jgi:hypothetical protein
LTVYGHRISVFINMTQRKVSGSKEDDVKECVLIKFIVCTQHKILFGLSSNGRCMQHAWGIIVTCTCFCGKTQWRMQDFFFRGGVYAMIIFRRGWGSTNLVEDRGQRERGSEGGSPLIRGSTRFSNEWNPFSDYFFRDAYFTELGIRLSFVKTPELRGGDGVNPQTPLGTPLIKHEGNNPAWTHMCGR